MIETKPYNLLKAEYRKIIISQRLKKSWWLYALLILLGIYHLQKFGQDSFSSFFTIFAFIYPCSVFVFLYFWSGSKGHNPIFDETKLAFDTHYFYFERNGNESKLNQSTIQKTITHNSYWLLYISKGQFIYVPKNIFYSGEDYEHFSALIEPK